MAGSSTALVDPLAAQDAIPVVASAPVPAAVRGERVAPDVRGALGAEAVRIVRAGGFIAAIEPVVSDVEREGTVIDQLPTPGVCVERETVLTLRLATAPEASEPSRQSASDEGPVSRPGDGLAERDDTEEWFAGVAGAGRGRAGEGASGVRRRKHRASQAPVGELVFDTPPEPQAMPTAIHTRIAAPSQAGRSGSGLWPLLRAGAGVFFLRVTRLPWRRIGVALAGVLLCVVIGMRAFASGGQGVPVADRGALAAQAPRPVKARVRVVLAPRRAPRVFLKPRARTVLHARLRAVSRAQRPQAAPSAPVVVAVVPSPPATEAAVPRAAPRPASNQFAYLGR